MYHVECLKCRCCNKELKTGDFFSYADKSTLYCMDYYHKNICLVIELFLVKTENTAESKRKSKSPKSCSEANGSPEKPESISEEVQTNHEANNNLKKCKQRGRRTSIKPHQIGLLTELYESERKPSRHTLEEMTKLTGLPIRVIQVRMGVSSVRSGFKTGGPRNGETTRATLASYLPIHLQ
ncbi:LIM/homeobox protein Lhx5-like [Octopus sinensis]|uniref:LIM/homeobox protein Lhx5-like n=1 Tax=Octopus sinensis TaxID=2607531 RepID=A0A6P7TVM6_9MOLL|nr:LIM/homeobox protein Lhx5-like [Octopus sinensis]XP_029657857.1 LIM/homeobox protein Lhx5-like [Octopus sinensis]